MKVFGIGAHRTGTTTLGVCLEIMGFTPQANDYNSNFLVGKETEKIVKYAVGFTSFQDSPWNHGTLYQALDAAFPESKFILTLRDPDRWFDSTLRWHQRLHLSRSSRSRDFQRITYNNSSGAVTPGLRDCYKKVFEQRNAEIQDYFRDEPEKLLIVDWEAGDSWKELCQFLDKAIPEEPFLKLNSLDDIRKPDSEEPGS